MNILIRQLQIDCLSFFIWWIWSSLILIGIVSYHWGIYISIRYSTYVLPLLLELLSSLNIWLSIHIKLLLIHWISWIPILIMIHHHLFSIIIRHISLRHHHVILLSRISFWLFNINNDILRLMILFSSLIRILSYATLVGIWVTSFHLVILNFVFDSTFNMLQMSRNNLLSLISSILILSYTNLKDKIFLLFFWLFLWDSFLFL